MHGGEDYRKKRVWSGKEEGIEGREEVIPVGSTCVEVKSSDIVRLE